MHKTLGEAGSPAELCIVVIRPDQILDAVREAVAAGHRNFLILPGGFAEAGDVGKARDAELRRLIAAEGLTVAGPNCAGIIHLPEDRRFGDTFLRDLPPGGGIAFISQSGALAEEVIASSNAMQIGIGTIGSMRSWGSMWPPFMVDMQPVVARFAEVARAVPLPMMHSMMGTLPGKAEWFGDIERAGVPMFNDVEEMCQCAGVLAQYPKLKAEAARPLPNRPPALRGRN